ncbi:MAG: glycosyltransferase family 1 protein [Chloroflexota bacterium]
MRNSDGLCVGLLAYGLDRPLTGITRYTVELIRALVQLQPAPDLVLLTAGQALAAAELRGYRSVPLRGSRLLPAFLTLGSLLVRQASQHEAFDVIHDPTGVTPFAFGTGDVPNVVTVHDVLTWAFPGTNTLLDTLIYRYWLPRCLPQVNAVITVSHASKADIIRYFKIEPSKVHVVPLGVPPYFQRVSVAQIEAVLARYQLPRRYLLSVGSQNKRRNLPRLIKAYALLRADGEQRPLLIVGFHQQTEEMNRLIESLHLRDRVVFLGRLPDSDLIALYSGTDVFVFPSLYEGFGLTPLEAMACGAPVVCSNSTSLPEVVGDAALTVDPYDVQAIAQAIHTVLADKTLGENLSEKGLQQAKAFTWERTAIETLQVYRTVARQ